MPARYLLSAVAAGLVAMPVAAWAEGEVVRIKRNPSALILEAARVNAGADTIYVSGQLASPLDPATPMTAGPPGRNVSRSPLGDGLGAAGGSRSLQWPVNSPRSDGSSSSPSS